MIGNGNISHPVGKVACPSIVQQIALGTCVRAVEQYGVLRQLSYRVEQVAMIDWTYAKYIPLCLYNQ